MSGSDDASKPPPSGPRNDYEIGYRRPPVHTRFKVGNPGNPTGRRKKKKTVRQIFESAMMQRINVEQNGRSRSMTLQEVIIFKLVRTSAQGDLRAIRTTFAMWEHYRDSSDTVLDPSELAAADRKILEEYLATLKPRETTSERGTENQAPNQDSDEHPDKTEDEAS
jgi:Family of unknown function (DUF5681)